MHNEDHLSLPGFEHFGALTKVIRSGSKHPVWVWNINSHDIEFNTTQMMSYGVFFRKCLRFQLQSGVNLKVVSPKQVTEEQWRCFVNKAMKPIRDAKA
jgi:hypothetical protein